MFSTTFLICGYSIGGLITGYFFAGYTWRSEWPGKPSHNVGRTISCGLICTALWPCYAPVGVFCWLEEVTDYWLSDSAEKVCQTLFG
jgi:hypothetical protein